LLLPLEKDAAKGAMNDSFSRARSRQPTRGKSNGANSIILFNKVSAVVAAVRRSGGE